MKHTTGVWMAASLILAAVLPGWADQTDLDTGRSGAPEMRLELGARDVGRGGACVASALGVGSLSWNPAGLGRSGMPQLEGMHSFYLQDTSLEQLAYVQPIGTNGGLGVQAVYVNYGTLEQTEEVDSVPQVTGTFHPGTWLLSLGYGHKVASGLTMGVVAKYYRNEILGHLYTAWAGDVGMQWATTKDEMMIGVALQNVGSGVAGYSLPLTVRAGAQVALPFQFVEDDRWTLSADMDYSRQGSALITPHVGTEYQYSFLALRAGYVNKTRSELGGVGGLSLGIGARGEKTYLDYAISSFGVLGLMHQISFGVLF